MKKRTPQKKEAADSIHINRIYSLALFTCLAFLVSGLLFVSYAARLIREETIGHIQEATEQTKFDIEEQVGEAFDVLLSASIVAQDTDILGHEDALVSMIRGLGAHGSFIMVGYAGKDGQGVWFDQYGRRHQQNFAGQDFFSRALEGENAIGRAQVVEPVGAEVHFCGVPVYEGNTNTVRGVLFAAIPQDEFRKIINHSLYAGQGLAHIADGNGDYVVKSDSPLVISIGDNIFALAEPFSEAAKQKVLDDFAARRAGHLEKSVYGENRLAAYAPLDINDWNVFYAVPENLVSAGLKTVTFGSAVAVSIATGVFILLLLLIRYVNNKNEKILERLAFVDPVTGKRNYQKFLLDAAKILKNAGAARYLISYSDIKGFKYVNDLFGRDVGDRLLRYWANIQETIAQEGEISARINGDNFVALRRFQSRRSYERRVESATMQLAVFPEIFSRGYRVELYVGAYIIDPEDQGLSLNDMLDRAIAAQEEARSAGGGIRFAFYSNEMREQKLWAAEIETMMDFALENNEFQVYMQPKIDIQHGNCILGAEALVRWLSPEKGLIPPGRFIGLFEKNGFILELDRFVFEKVCRYYRETVLDGGLPRYILSVNVSRLALMQPDFLRSYSAIKEQYGIPDGCIELEFTESLAFGDHTLFKTVVTECKRCGFLCSMDDFGAGYSSLNMLKSIHVDVLKMDRQFFLYGEDAERGQELVKNIIVMAKALNMKVIAEGVDEEVMVEQLREMGCDAIQGYIFSKPMPLEDFMGFAQSWPGYC